MHLQLSGEAAVGACMCVTATKPLGFLFILGMDGIKALGGGEVRVDAQSIVSFGVDEPVKYASTILIVKIFVFRLGKDFKN